MSDREYLQSSPAPAILVALGLTAVGTAVGGPPESDLAAPGSPLYQFAVDESVRSLLSQQEQAELGVAGRPPSPGPDYYWCDNHKAYHRKETPAVPGQPGLQSPAAGVQHVNPGQGGPAPAGTYWCDSCKSYHQGQKPAHQHAAGSAASAGLSAPSAEGGARLDGSGPPAEPREGFYWCEQCKSYHRNPEPGDHPGGSPTPALSHSAVSPPSGAGQPAGADFYYCDNCKTYHRRQASGLNADLSHGLEGSSNLYQSPLSPEPAPQR